MRQTEWKIGKRVALGVFVALAAYLGLLAMAAALLARGAVGEGNALLCTLLCASLAGLTGALMASWGAAEPLAPAIICVGLSFAAFILLGFLVNNALDPRRVVTLAAAMIAGGAPAALKRTGKRGRKRTRRSRR